MTRFRDTIAILWIAALTPSLGCENVECGSGTTLMNGVCVAGRPDDPVCGAGTEFNMTTGRCEALDQCGPNTQPEFDDAGNRICVGTGGGDCTANLCPPAMNGLVAVCGRVHDLGTLVPLDNSVPLDVGIYSPIDFVTSPGTTEPLEVVSLDSCGRYFAQVPVQTGDLIAVGVNDAGELSPPGSIGVNDLGNYRLSAVAARASSGARVELPAFATLNATNTSWSTSAGLSPSFSQQGVFVGIYVDDNAPAPVLTADPTENYPFRTNAGNGAPTAGVTITVSSIARPGFDYYFTDSDPTTLTTVAADGPTGATGAGLLINSPSIAPHGGTGPANCTWDTNTLAAAVAGVILVMPVPGTCN